MGCCVLEMMNWVLFAGAGLYRMFFLGAVKGVKTVVVG